MSNSDVGFSVTVSAQQVTLLDFGQNSLPAFSHCAHVDVEQLSLWIAVMKLQSGSTPIVTTFLAAAPATTH